MQPSTSKKEAIRKYKEQKPLRGIYAIRCAATSRVWVGSSPNLDATKNGAWFSLRNSSHIEKSLQAEWNAHGEAGFQYEILETLEDDLHPLAVPDLLKEKRRLWIAQLGARPLL